MGNSFPDIEELVWQGFDLAERTRWPTYDGGELDRSRYMTSSEAGNCLRQIAFSKLPGIPTSRESENPAQGYFQRGHNVEAWIVQQLRRVPDLLMMYEGDNQRSFYRGNQSGTPDGLITWGRPSATNYCLEIKSVDPRTNFRNLPKPNHVMQTQQNMDLMSYCLGIKVEKSVIYYQDASNYKICKQKIIEADPAEQERLRLRAEIVATTPDPEDMPPEGIYNGGCGYCDFTELCSDMVQQKKTTTTAERASRLVGDKLFK